MSKMKKLYSDADYIEYMEAYDEFYKKMCTIFGTSGCPRLDSQFSENIAADKVGFALEHKNGFDGVDNLGKTYEVKGTGYTNTKVRFSSKKADYVIWVKATPGKVFLYEMDVRLYSNLDKNGFIDMSTQKKIKEICTLEF